MQYQLLMAFPARRIFIQTGSVTTHVTKFCVWGLLLALYACSLAPQGAPSVKPSSSQVTSSANTLSSRTSSSSSQVAKVPIRELEKPVSSAPSSVEVIWAMPPQPVEGFVLHYGLQKEFLDRKVKVPAESLEKHSDPEKGLVYRYLLEDIAPDKPVFVAVSAFASGQESPPSDVYEVTP